jgi:hypothetical protein
MHSSRPAAFWTNASRCRTEPLPDGRENTPFNPQKCPLNIKNTLYINNITWIRFGQPAGSGILVQSAAEWQRNSVPSLLLVSFA